MDDYEFKGVKLTPKVFEKLLIQLFDGKQFERKDAIDKIRKYHVENGGIVEENRDLVSVFKKASQNLKSSNSGLTNKSYGDWELHYQVKELQGVVEHVEDKTIDYAVDEIFGSGDNSVYLYYYDIYKRLAEEHGETTWPCKIGRTDRDPIQRVIGQAGTCYPELPHVALIIHCDDSSLLENAVHDVLKAQNKWMSSAPGTEWFVTSPDKVKKIYFMIQEEK